MIRYVTVALGIILSMTSVGCSGEDELASIDTGQGVPVQGVPGPRPPNIDCVFPDRAKDLMALRANSDLVVRGRVDAPPEFIVPDANAAEEDSQPTAQISPGQRLPPQGTAERYIVNTIRQLERRSETVPDTLVLIEPAGSEPLLREGEYILFLAQGGIDERTGSRAYFVVDGMRGAFLIGAGRVSLECPNYDDPSNRIVAKAPAQGPMFADDFVDMLLSLPQPSRGAIPLHTPGKPNSQDDG